MVGCCYFAPVASRVSPRRASYFFLRRQKKVTKKKASHVRAASRCLALLAAFGTLANSLRSNSASVLIRTLLRCSARPNGGGYHTARPLRELRPNGLFASLTLRGLGCLISHTSLLARARHAVPLQPSKTAAVPKLRHSARSRGIHVCLHSNLDAATTRSMTACAGQRCPHHPHHSPSFLTPTPSLLTPHSSPLTPHSSLLTPHSSLLTPHSLPGHWCRPLEGWGQATRSEPGRGWARSVGVGTFWS